VRFIKWFYRFLQVVSRILLMDGPHCSPSPWAVSSVLCCTLLNVSVMLFSHIQLCCIMIVCMLLNIISLYCFTLFYAVALLSLLCSCNLMASFMYFSVVRNIASQIGLLNVDVNPYMCKNP